jgi:pyruvate,water dikinase
LDSYCGKTAAKNYINFEFKGGAADDLRRNRRARLIERVLTGFGFMVRTAGDRVTARFAKVEAKQIENVLDQVGRLLIYTRQLDMLMHSEEMVEQMASCFLNADYCLAPETTRHDNLAPKSPS